MTFGHLCGSSLASCLSHLKGSLLLLPAAPYMLFSHGMCLPCRLSGVGGSALFGDGVMTVGQVGGECKPTGTSSGGEVEVRIGDMWTSGSHLYPQSHCVFWAVACGSACMHTHCPSLPPQHCKLRLQICQLLLLDPPPHLPRMGQPPSPRDFPHWPWNWRTRPLAPPLQLATTLK